MSYIGMTNVIAMVATIAKVLKNKEIRSQNDLIELSRKGLQAKYLSTVMTYTGMNNKELANALPISERQLVRYASDKVMNQEITERLLRIIELYSFGYDYFLVQSEFQRWMRTENMALGGVSPISLIDTGYGLDMVRIIIGRAMHGVYS